MLFASRLSLRRNVEILLASVLLPAVVLVIVNAYATRNRERAEVQQDAYRVARLAATTPEQLAETTEQLFTSLALLPWALGHAPETCTADLEVIAASTRRYRRIGIIDRAGHVVCSTRQSDMALSVADRGWFRAARDRMGLAVGSFESDGFTGGPSVVFARQARQADTVLFAALDLDWLASAISRVPLPAESSVNVVDHTGTLLARHPAHAEWVAKNVKSVPVIATALARRDGTAEAEGIDGVVRLYGYHVVDMPGGSSITITVGVPLHVAYAAANQRLWANLGMLGTVALLTVWVAGQATDRLFTQKVVGLLRTARRISAGDLSARTDLRWTNGELGELARSVDSMAWTLEQRATEAHEALEALRALAARLESVREEERTRISREIHDELGQVLTGIRMDLDRLNERLGKTSLSETERQPLDSKVQSVRALADRALDTSRRISRQLRPSVLDVLGLRASVEWQLEEFEARTGISSELVVEGDVAGVDEQMSTTLFRILQEALTNVARHAQATSVTVRLGVEHDVVALEVMDNGCGFEPQHRPNPASLGLLGMRERALAVGGQASITSGPGRGTIVTVSLPVAGKSPA